MPANSAAMLPEVGQPQHHHGEEGDAQPELFADQVREPLAGDRAHARRHLLHHNQRDGGRDQRPEQGIAELGAGLRIGQDAAGIVVHVGGDEAGSHHREKGRQPEPDERPSQAPGAVRFPGVVSWAGCMQAICKV